ncbi:HAMP domain-containing sensor histidine kinase [Sulfuricurvum sp.]|uniref:sensor histidine kinase n=1 Tax=Sulfuricurvum sp. TaxID=2025608 RepID=UPI0026372AED|nr:HAMP domain-containing sensor histidine kinase [Sulfuricurvum sp.]MDD2781741.1 HAMP domain-containing sensor histidine kinase [Sulfuricurvum sp.]
MDQLALSPASFFSTIYIDFTLFVFITFVTLGMVRYYINYKNTHLTHHLSGFKPMLSKLLTKYTIWLLLLLFFIFIILLVMLYIIAYAQQNLAVHFIHTSSIIAKSIHPIYTATFIFASFATLLTFLGYYFITIRDIARLQTNYFVDKLNLHQNQLEEQIESEVIKRQEQERMLGHQARLAAMGEMISNITHQWRQPLTAISNIVQETQDAFKYNELNEASMQENTRNIRTQLNQMSNTIDDFRNFFSPSKTISSFYAKDQIKTTLSMLQGMLQKNNITVDLYIDGDTKIQGYANEYNHVLINLFNNARDILLERAIESPRITIRIDESNGHSVVIFADNGGGIPVEIADKIFNPYFTTKGEIHGTGIGLYMCKQIIENNMHGNIRVHNNEDGAVFTITI